MTTDIATDLSLAIARLTAHRCPAALEDLSGR
jgi:hypothetical protein